jgi:diadenosine tetraphosphate (Ap4A) HIT family hydrolase
MEMHTTLVKFGYPKTELVSLERWSIVLRPQQITLASLVLIAKSDATAFSTLPDGAHAELAKATRIVETGLRQFRPYDRINYLMLMMVDPHVHMHVLPRYTSPQAYSGVEFRDSAWPGPPDVKAVIDVPDSVFQLLHGELRATFQRAAERA